MLHTTKQPVLSALQNTMYWSHRTGNRRCCPLNTVEMYMELVSVKVSVWSHSKYQHPHIGYHSSVAAVWKLNQTFGRPCILHETTNVKQQTILATQDLRFSQWRLLLRHKAAILWKSTSVSEECVMCHLHLQTLFAACFMLLSCFVYSSVLKTGVTCSSEVLLDFQWTIQRYRTLQFKQYQFFHGLL